MRISSFFFLLLFFTPSLQAANTADIDSALSKLDDATSDWQYMLEEARSTSFDKAASEGDCAFWDSPKVAAPDWVCYAPVEGVEVTAVGSGRDEVPADQIEQVSEERGDYINRVDAPIKAYIDALASAQAKINVAVDKMVRAYSDAVGSDAVGEDVMKGNTLKQITSLASLSGKTQLKQMLKNYAEYDENGKKTAVVSSTTLKLSHSSERCKTLIKAFAQETSTQKVSDETVDIAESKVSRGQCGFHQIVEDMSASGWILLEMIKSPGGVYYVLVGRIGPIGELQKAFIKTSAENDKNLWEQFKAQRGDMLEMEMKKEFGSE